MENNVWLMQGDCIEKLKQLEDSSVDSIVTDPPYELGFMGKGWDKSGIANNVEMWKECFRVLKPGGHMLAFSGSRTYHRMTCAIEDAGFEIRDQIMWVYGSGFPKSMDVAKAIDKTGGINTENFKKYLAQVVSKSGKSRTDIDKLCGFTMRFDTPYDSDPVGWGVSLPSPEKWLKICEVLEIDSEKWQELIDRVWRGRRGEKVSENSSMSGSNFERGVKGSPVTEEAKQWEGWGTALKPAHEPICVARKPLVGTVAANVLQFGTGALNIGGCRVEGGERPLLRNLGNKRENTEAYGNGKNGSVCEGTTTEGRWPANFIHDGSAEVVELFPDAKGQQGKITGKEPSSKTDNVYGMYEGRAPAEPRIELDKSAARFFYCAKASKKDRGEGNNHPTVKPQELMKYLVRLVTPPNGVVLDPFMGSGSTGVAAKAEGMSFIGIDMDENYFQIAEKRINGEVQKVA